MKYFYIIHQVNCQNAFGAGFADLITKHYPHVKEDYHAHCTGKSPQQLFGTYHITDCGNFGIVHIFSQYYYGNAKKNGKCYTNYNKMIEALSAFRSEHPTDPACAPVNMGCGFAGGDWDIVKVILDKHHIQIKEFGKKK